MSKQVWAFSWGEDRDEAIMGVNAPGYIEYNEDTDGEFPSGDELTYRGYYAIEWLITWYEDGPIYYKVAEYEPEEEEEEEDD